MDRSTTEQIPGSHLQRTSAEGGTPFWLDAQASRCARVSVLASIPLVLALIGSPATAATIYVGNHGSDASGCGAIDAPCRTISQGVRVAAAGDRLVVQPGVYGDVDGDGEFVTPGDEPAQFDDGCRCLVSVDKPLTIVSEAGAGATILRGAVDGMYAVAIDAPNVTLGRKKQGFAIVGDLQHDGFGVRVNGGASNARIEGNLVSRLDKGLFVAGDGARIVGNRIAEVFRQGIHAEGSGITIAANVLEQVGTPGENDSAIHAVGRGAGDVIDRNLVVGNLGIGIYVDDGAGNSAASPHVVTDNLVVGNRAAGIKVVLAASSGGVRITGNSLYANDAEGGGNCGLMTLSAGPAIDATNNWWGTPAGPGPDPSDDVCSVGTAPTTGAAASIPFVRVAPPMR